MAFHDESQVYRLFFFEKVHISASASVEFQIWLRNDVGWEMMLVEKRCTAQTQLGSLYHFEGPTKKTLDCRYVIVFQM